jgi:putative endonuclease
VKGFTEQYNVDRLVYYEAFDNAEAAIKRERGMKEWRRDWKIELIEARNPEWHDLFAEVCA